ncbi:MAG: CRISPR-associated endoribonuclease Cas6, partial [Chthonomonadetes bacterium]|nr:CRISPR-associated endoribonuclease Cas6 [Chthonomonadetes bacterium]
HVNKRNEHIVFYKDTVIKAWSGVYEVSLPEPLFRMAMDAGLGSKNSQGFGCMGIYERRMREVVEG